MAVNIMLTNVITLHHNIAKLQCTLLCCGTQQNETHLGHADNMNE